MSRTPITKYQLEFDQAGAFLHQINTRNNKLKNRIIALRSRIQKVFSSIERSNELLNQMGQKLEAIREKGN
jgi:hypothetical protein